VRILPSALKHGVAEEDILHALRVSMREVDHGDSLLLVIGVDQHAQLLEVVVADPDGDDPRVIHAMPLRPKFLRYLGNREHD
jgi:hypothetical protein